MKKFIVYLVAILFSFLFWQVSIVSAKVMVAVGTYHTVGLKSDGMVVAVGDNSVGQCDVCSWTDIKQVAAGGGHTVGLKRAEERLGGKEFYEMS